MVQAVGCGFCRLALLEVSMDIFDVAVSKLDHLTQASVPTDHPHFLQVGTQPPHSKDVSVPPGQGPSFLTSHHPGCLKSIFGLLVTPAVCSLQNCHCHALPSHCFCKGGWCSSHAITNLHSNIRQQAMCCHAPVADCTIACLHCQQITQASITCTHSSMQLNLLIPSLYTCTGIKATHGIQPYFVPLCQLEAHERHSAELLLEASAEPRHRQKGARFVHRGRC